MTCEKQAVVGLDADKHFVEQTLLRLEAVGLVHHHVGPLHLLEEAAVLDDELVVGEQSIEGDGAAAVVAFVLADNLARRRVPVVHHHVHLRGPLLKLLLPGGHGGERHAHEHGALEGVVVPQVFEETDGLDGLAEAHLVGQDEAVVFGPGIQQEVDSVNLEKETGAFFLSYLTGERDDYPVQIDPLL